ncbi:MAG: transcriptional regulator [Pseudomonadota bacterium]
MRNCLNEKAIVEIMKLAGRTNRTKFRDQVLKPLLEAGWLEMAIPGKPTSSKQKYRLTEKGKQWVRVTGLES